MNTDIYKKEKVGQRGNISIFVVDGKKIRDELDIEFTNFGQHYKFSYIPENEFWLDEEASPNERNYFIDHLLVEWKLMKRGIIYEDAIVAADSIEAKERKRANYTNAGNKRPSGTTINEIHKKLYGTTTDGLNIWIVDGKNIRNNFDIDFTEGGHDLVYDFVPENEVWIDDDIKEEEVPFVLIHELQERASMSKGLKYADAHYGTKNVTGASEIEWDARHNPQKTIEMLNTLHCNI